MHAAFALSVSLLFLLTGCAAPDVPLDTPIVLAPRGAVEQNIEIGSKQLYLLAFAFGGKQDYVLDLAFARDLIPYEKLKKDIGAMHVCMIDEPCSKGIVVPVRWSLQNAANGTVAASGEVDSLDSTGWGGDYVYRRIGKFSVDRGSYLFRIEVLRDVPELAYLRSRVMIYHEIK